MVQEHCERRRVAPVDRLQGHDFLALQFHMDVGTGVQEAGDGHAGIMVRRGGHERREPELRGDVWIRSMGKERLHDLVGARAVEKGRRSVRIEGVRLGPALKEGLDGRGITPVGRHQERRVAVAVQGAYIRTGPEEGVPPGRVAAADRVNELGFGSGWRCRLLRRERGGKQDEGNCDRRADAHELGRHAFIKGKHRFGADWQEPRKELAAHRRIKTGGSILSERCSQGNTPAPAKECCTCRPPCGRRRIVPLWLSKMLKYDNNPAFCLSRLCP